VECISPFELEIGFYCSQSVSKDLAVEVERALECLEPGRVKLWMFFGAAVASAGNISLPERQPLTICLLITFLGEGDTRRQKTIDRGSLYWRVVYLSEAFLLRL